MINRYDEGVCFILSNVIMLINIMFVLFPLSKEYKNEIRWYQTPFVFVIFFTGEGMINIGTLILINSPFSSAYIYIGVVVIGLIFTIFIIFFDQQATICKKTEIFFCCLAILIFLFLCPLFSLKAYFYFLLIVMIIYSIGPVECLIGTFIYKKYDIIPIMNVFTNSLFNILRIVSFIGYGLIYIINIIGLIFCIAQIIVYFVYRSKRDNQNTIQPGALMASSYQQMID